MNLQRKCPNVSVPKVRQGAKCIAIRRIILWTGERKSADISFLVLLRRMSTMQSLLPANSFLLR